MKASTILTLGLVVGGASAFAPTQPRTASTTSLAATVQDRRHFFEAAGAMLVAGSALPALALEDLAEPTEEEKEAALVRTLIGASWAGSIRYLLNRDWASRHSIRARKAEQAHTHIPWFSSFFSANHETFRVFVVATNSILLEGEKAIAVMLRPGFFDPFQ